MSEPKNFLARWSERKRHLEPEKPPEEKKPSLPAENVTKESPDSVVEFDISTLPPLDSITSNSDIRAFLQRGVPAALRHAALRRVWSADPAIRDFVGLSENSWDFNAPHTIPGFGSMTAADVQSSAQRLLDTLSQEKNIQASEENARESAIIPPEKQQRTAELGSKPDIAGTDPERQASNAAAQHEEDDRPADAHAARRRHGGALPK
jgi:hypothetical protein